MANEDIMAQINKLTSQLSKMTEFMETMATKMTHLEKEKVAVLDTYSDPPNLDQTLIDSLPEKFSIAELPKFKPTDNPKYFLKGFKFYMDVKKINPKLYPRIFPMTLEPVCQKWFFSLSDKDTATWEDITQAFMTRYRSNTQAKTSQRELEILKQGEKEGFTAYLARWRETAAQMVTQPPEDKMVKSFISTLQPKYKEHLRYLGLSTLDKVYRIGMEIEDNLRKANKGKKWHDDTREDDLGNSSEHDGEDDPGLSEEEWCIYSQQSNGSF